MNTNTFDQIVSRVHPDASRRQMLGGVIGTLAALVAGGTVLEAKPKAASRRQRRGPGNTGGSAGSKKVAVCHVTTGGERVQRLRVGRRALQAHLAHGDVRFVDCCVNTDCDVGACFSAQCVAGTCSQTQLPQGTPCSLDGPAGGTGSCTPSGACVPAGSGGG